MAQYFRATVGGENSFARKSFAQGITAQCFTVSEEKTTMSKSKGFVQAWYSLKPARQRLLAKIAALDNRPVSRQAALAINEHIDRNLDRITAGELLSKRGARGLSRRRR